MPRRRRNGNKLLGRILMISVGAHVVALPILAHYGAFEKIRREFTQQVIVIPPPPPNEEKPEVKKKAEPKKQVAKAKGENHAAKAAQAHNNAPHPPVVASNAPSTSGGDNTGPAINPNGTGTVGKPPGDGSGGGAATPKPEPQPTTTNPEPKTQPEAKPTTQPKPTTEPAPKPHVPVLVSAEPTYQPQPQIPDDLRADALDKTCVIDISVNPDGTTGDVKLGESCGVDELDQIAMDAAKRWKFAPATVDGQPVQGKVRLHIHFKVD